MKKIYLYAAGLAMMLLPTSCMQEFQPQGGSVTAEQAANAPGSYNNFVSSITSNISGVNVFSSARPNDFGLPSLYLMREMTGNDMVAVGGGYNWFGTWYQCGTGLGPNYLNCQYPWTFYYSQIKSCNTVLSLAGETPDENKKVGAGIAHAMRAMFYIDLVQMFSNKSYAEDPQGATVPLITESINLSSATNNPRMPYAEALEFIVSDLNKAEELLNGYVRTSKTVPDNSVVYGLKARAYLLKEDWANAEKYAKMAQLGYQPLTAADFADRVNGFNNMNTNNSWMLGCTFAKEKAVMVNSDGNHSWATWMVCETPSDKNGYGYYAALGAGCYIDKHLFTTIPATDARKQCWVDFSVDELGSKAAVVKALSAYSDVPENVYGTGANIASNSGNAIKWGGMPLKFRARGGEHVNILNAFCVDVPMMRVEEMMLIEAEAAGRQDEARGKALLEAFAKLRDANYTYGTHTDQYGDNPLSTFLCEIWWQRRVELWGEGLAMFDIKRFNRGIIRSYAGTNHIDGYRWNTNTPPQWMTFCIVQTEGNYNEAIANNNNPIPVAPKGNSEEHQW